MSDQRVTISIERGVADVRMNRPEKLNALDVAQFEAIVDAGESLKRMRDVRAVVVSGNGRGFCAGLDVGDLHQISGEGRAAGASGDGWLTRLGAVEGRITHLAQQSCWVWQELEVPVIAAVHGVALGGGCQLALGADIRIAAPNAQFSMLELRWGITQDMTGTATLPRLVRLDVAKELTFTGRMLSGEEAVAIGLVTRISDTPLDDALVMAYEIACKSPTAVRGAKKLLNASPNRGVAEQFEDERQTIRSLIGSPNQAEAVMAYFEKRDPHFED